MAVDRLMLAEAALDTRKNQLSRGLYNDNKINPT